MNGTSLSLYDEAQGFPGWIYGIVALAFLGILAVASLRMTTRVTPEALIARFGFLYSARVPLADIEHAEAIVYRPVRDYGGWGIRGIGRRRAVNARGNQGVLLVRRDGSTLLVGSQRPAELLAALHRAGVTTENKIPPDVREF